MARDYRSGRGQSGGGQSGQGPWRSDEGRSNRWRDDNEGRYPSADQDRDYDYRYTRGDEGDSSVRAGSYDQGRVQFGRRDRGDRPGPSGRHAGYGNFGQGDYGSERAGVSGRGRHGDAEYEGGSYRGDYDNEYGYGRQGGYGGDFGAGRYGVAGSRSRFEMGQSDSDYGYGDHGRGRYGGSQGSTGWRGYGAAGEFSRGWNEPNGEGQQYTAGGDYAGMRGPGTHRGKGPKGYQRSDDRLKEMLCERLREDPDIDASDISISVQGGRVTLDGTVDSRRTKNLAEDAAEQLGVEEVQNNLRVQRRDAAGTPSGSQGMQGRGSGTLEQSKSKQH